MVRHQFLSPIGSILSFIEGLKNNRGKVRPVSLYKVAIRNRGKPCDLLVLNGVLQKETDAMKVLMSGKWKKAEKVR